MLLRGNGIHGPRYDTAPPRNTNYWSVGDIVGTACGHFVQFDLARALDEPNFLGNFLICLHNSNLTFHCGKVKLLVVPPRGFAPFEVCVNASPAWESDLGTELDTLVAQWKRAPMPTEPGLSLGAFSTPLCLTSTSQCVNTDNHIASGSKECIEQKTAAAQQRQKSRGGRRKKT